MNCVGRVLAQIAPPVRTLLAARFFRSVWQGALAADFALYLTRLDWRGEQIGMLFAASFVVGAVLSLLVGPLSDRCGYRRLLVGYETTVAGLFVAATCSTNSWLLSVATVLGGFGRGANGAPGCFVPAELAWLAALLPEQRRAGVFSVNTALGFSGMAIGGIVAVGPGLWAGGLSGAAAFRPLFAIGAVLALFNAGLLCGTPAGGSGNPGGGVRYNRAPMAERRRRLLLRVTAINVCNGLSVGLSGPLIAYWFATKFHVGPVQIGAVMLAGFFSAAVCAVAVGGVVERTSAGSVFIRMQWASLLLMLALPFIATFPVAATAWVIKFALERGSGGALEAVNVGLAGPGRWGLASGLTVGSLALPRSIGPLMAGHWIASAAFAPPLLAAVVLQAVYLMLYRRTLAPRQAQADQLALPPPPRLEWQK